MTILQVFPTNINTSNYLYDSNNSSQNITKPRIIRIQTNDEYAIITALNYLSVYRTMYVPQQTDFILMIYGSGLNNAAIFKPVFSGNNITLQLLDAIPFNPSLLLDGNVTFPSLSFHSDLHKGINSPDINQIGIDINATNQCVITNQGVILNNRFELALTQLQIYPIASGNNDLDLSSSITYYTSNVLLMGTSDLTPGMVVRTANSTNYQSGSIVTFVNRIMPPSPSPQTITIKHLTAGIYSQFRLKNNIDYAMTGLFSTLTCIFDGTIWYEISRSNP